MILAVTMNPSVDRTLFINGLTPFDANRVLKSETDAGGKGINAARIIAELGEEVLAMGFLAGKTGGYVRHVLKAEGVSESFIEVGGETRTNLSIEDGSGNPPTTFNEKGAAVSAQHQNRLYEQIAALASSSSFLTAGGSLPPNVPSNAYARIVDVASGCKTVIDADGDALKEAVNARPYMIKPNADEAGRLLGREIATADQGVDAAREIRSNGIQVVVVSMGKLGAALACEEGTYFATPPTIEAVSTIGAGDSLVGGMLVGMVQGRTIREALTLGVAAGAATAATGGAEIGRKQKIDELFGKVTVREA